MIRNIVRWNPKKRNGFDQASSRRPVVRRCDRELQMGRSISFRSPQIRRNIVAGRCKSPHLLWITRDYLSGRFLLRSVNPLVSRYRTCFACIWGTPITDIKAAILTIDIADEWWTFECWSWRTTPCGCARIFGRALGQMGGHDHRFPWRVWELLPAARLQNFASQCLFCFLFLSFVTEIDTKDRYKGESKTNVVEIPIDDSLASEFGGRLRKPVLWWQPFRERICNPWSIRKCEGNRDYHRWGRNLAGCWDHISARKVELDAVGSWNWICGGKWEGPESGNRFWWK